MQPHKYELTVHWSDEDGVFVVEVPELAGCTAHGAIPTLAVANAQEAIAAWLEVAHETGRPIPKPGGRRVSAT